MKIIVFGLSISSAWGNGHATLLRGLFRALHELGHQVHFFERDVPYYASHRDANEFPFVDLHLYASFTNAAAQAQRLLRDADAAIVTSYCPDGPAASTLVRESRVIRKLFYDMDTPVTLLRLQQHEAVDYLPADGLSGFDLVLSYTGGDALRQLETQLGAQRTAALHGWVDSALYYPVPSERIYESDLSYLGTYSLDRQAKLEELLLRPAEKLSGKRFVIGGAMYPDAPSWPKNVRHLDHVPPSQHCAFYCSSPLTLSVTRGAMAAMGYCPSGRLFEAAACGTAVLSDYWKGLDEFFTPGHEIIVADSAEDTVEWISHAADEVIKIGKRARARALDCHTADIRAARLVELIESGSEMPVPEEWSVTEGA